MDTVPQTGEDKRGQGSRQGEHSININMSQIQLMANSQTEPLQTAHGGDWHRSSSGSPGSISDASLSVTVHCLCPGHITSLSYLYIFYLSLNVTFYNLQTLKGVGPFVRRSNGMPLEENNLVSPWKIEHGITMRPLSSSPEYIPRDIEHRGPNKTVHTHVHPSSIHRDQWVKTTQVLPTHQEINQ